MAKTARSVPAPLVEGARRFAQWRRRRRTRRIPEELCSVAARLGAEHGVSRTARALGVYYYGLRKRIDASGASPREKGAAPAFVEVLASPAPSASEHVVEIESACGNKMRIQTRGGSAPDLAALSRLFLEQAT